jgi:HlyD family type I secretion membrane fusion protein
MTSNTNTNFLPPVQPNEFLPPISRWITFGGLLIVGVVGTAIAVTAVVKYKVTVKGQASIRPAGEVRLVQAATEGSVMHIGVNIYQAVEQGDVIATIDDSQLQTKKSQLQSSIQQAQLQQVQIKAQISALDRQINAETDRINRTIASAEAELESRRREYQDSRTIAIAEVEEAEANLGATQAAFSAARSKHQRYQSIAESGAISTDRLEEAQLDMEQQAQALEAAQAKLQRTQTALNPTSAKVAIAIEQIAQERASGQANLATLAKEREALIQQQVEIDKQLERDTRELQQVEIHLKQTTITATADGIITRLNLRNPGQTVQVGEQIAQIVPSNSPLEIKAAVLPDDIEKVKIGQAVQMRVSACPYPDYGVLKGIVSNISEDTIKPEENAAGASSSASTTRTEPTFYEVAIAPESRSLGRDESHQCALQVGMEGRVDIVSREETVLKFLLRKARLIADV